MAHGRIKPEMKKNTVTASKKLLVTFTIQEF
jgi:hypothetical protein